MTDQHWMRRALVLARRALGQTMPNPLVGAIVLDASGKKVGEGYHRKAGEAHAEIPALNQAGIHAQKGTLYVTLEPCSHQGRTPPCVHRIVESGVRRVVIAAGDPNPLVNGQGIAFLKSRGVEVIVGVEETLATQLNLPFFTWIQKRRPFVTAKVALSSDGKIGVRGKAIRISDRATSATTMRLRAEAGAILVGVETIANDNPKLTVRGRYHGRIPIRAIIDPHLRTPSDSQIFSETGPVWIFCSDPDPSSAHALEKKGARIISTDLSPQSILDHFRDITAVLVEGGAKTFSYFAHGNLIDRWVIFESPTPLDDPASVPLEPLSLKYHSVIRRGVDREIWATQN